MRTKFVETNLPERYIHVIKNSESTASIPQGTPLVLNLTGAKQPTTDQNGKQAGFEDGLQVVLPATGGAFAAQFYHYGVCLAGVVAGQYGEAVLHGIVPFAIIKYATRSASTASWTSSASIAASVLLSIDTIDNAFTTIASNSTYASTNNQTQYLSAGFGAQAILLDSVASFAASATATTDARTVLTALKRVFVRMM